VSFEAPSFEAIRYELRGAVAVLTLDRPERLNAINPALRDEIHAALEAACADDQVRALVITGAGRGFCAGADLTGRGPADVAEAGGQAEKLDEVMWMGRFALALQAFDKPLIAAVNGVAAGGGMGLALAADLRVGSDQTRFKTVFAERALGPDCGVSYFLPRIVGYSRAADLLLTCRMVDAQEAYRLGLLDRLVAHANLLEETLALAAQIAEGPPLALRIAKRTLQAGADATLAEAVRDEAKGWAMAQKAADDQTEAARAFAEKRKAVFTGT
jgi:2-(1,2-epoxy-1,2-dihydrophenyl)acetyl-CoA isomerase